MSSTAPAVHLCLLRPWQQAVDWFFPGDDDDPDVDDLTWQTPSPFAAGDIMVYVADAPSPAIIQVETLSSGSEGEGISASPETEWGPYSAGLSLKAIERRVDDYLPMAPATLAEPLAQRFLTALEAEASDPSLWRDVDDSWCRLGHSDDPPPAPPFGPHTCGDAVRNSLRNGWPRPTTVAVTTPRSPTARPLPSAPTATAVCTNRSPTPSPISSSSNDHRALRVQRCTPWR